MLKPTLPLQALGLAVTTAISVSVAAQDARPVFEEVIVTRRETH